MAGTRDIQVLRVEDTETGERFSAGAPWFVNEGGEGAQDEVVDGVDANRANVFKVGSIVKLDPALSRKTLKTSPLAPPVLVDVPRLALPGSPLSKLTKASRLRVTEVVNIGSGVDGKHKRIAA